MMSEKGALMVKVAGKQFRVALKKERPLQIAGAVNAYSAIMAKEAGFLAIYLSGAGVANVSYGLPDLGITTFDNVFEDAKRITEATDLPLLVDIDTGFGNVLTIERAIKNLERIGVAGVHIEDQCFEKKCGHLPEKSLVPLDTAEERIKACVRARKDPDFVIMARTDAIASEGLDGALERAKMYEKAGCDMLFFEAVSNLSDYKVLKRETALPILANLTEFGKTPLYTVEELRSVGVDMVLYPLSAARAMHQAAWKVFQTIKREGTQKNCLTDMQSRKTLYQYLHYEEFADKLT